MVVGEEVLDIGYAENVPSGKGHVRVNAISERSSDLENERTCLPAVGHASAHITLNRTILS